MHNKQRNNLKQITMAKFRKVELSIYKDGGYGSYIIEANYKGELIKVRSHNSECYDWLDDNSDPIKHNEAKRYAYNMIVEAYNNRH